MSTSISDPHERPHERPTPYGFDVVHAYPMTTRPVPGPPESPHDQSPPAQSHPDRQPSTTTASGRSPGCVEDWLDIFCCCCLFDACF